MHVELEQQVLHVHLHALVGNAEPLGDFVVRKPDRDKLQDLPFARRQVGHHLPALIYLLNGLWNELAAGVNGLDGFVREPSRFTESYRALIDGVLAVSPDTRILLQSVYPVASAIGLDGDVDAQNAAIRRLNEQIEALAEQWEATRYVDTASVLTGGDGRLLSQYDSGDGIHLTNDAYRQILSYLRTHAWI